MFSFLSAWLSSYAMMRTKSSVSFLVVTLCYEGQSPYHLVWGKLFPFILCNALLAITTKLFLTRKHYVPSREMLPLTWLSIRMTIPWVKHAGFNQTKLNHTNNICTQQEYKYEIPRFSYKEYMLFSSTLRVVSKQQVHNLTKWNATAETITSALPLVHMCRNQAMKQLLCLWSGPNSDQCL